MKLDIVKIADFQGDRVSIIVRCGVCQSCCVLIRHRKSLDKCASKSNLWMRWICNCDYLHLRLNVRKEYLHYSLLGEFNEQSMLDRAGAISPELPGESCFIFKRTVTRYG